MSVGIVGQNMHQLYNLRDCGVCVIKLDKGNQML